MFVVLREKRLFGLGEYTFNNRILHGDGLDFSSSWGSPLDAFQNSCSNTKDHLVSCVVHMFAA